MFNSKTLISGVAAMALTLLCAESALAHRMRQNVYDRRTGRSFTTEVNHRHTRSGRVVLMDRDNNGRGNSFGNNGRGNGFGNSQNVLPQGILGAPTVTYTTYTSNNPYSSSNYRYEDRGGYRYYQDNNGSVLGRVLQAVVQNSR